MRCFISYSHADAEQFKTLRKHLKLLAGVTVWTDQEIKAGDSWDPAIQRALAASDIILLCVSADFFWSRYIETVELKQARARHLAGSAVIIPVILRDCMWQADPFLKELAAVPRDGKAIHDWHPNDKGYADAVRRIAEKVKAVTAGAAP